MNIERWEPLEIAFWLALGTVAYAYIGYAVVVWLASVRRPDPAARSLSDYSHRTTRDRPKVSLVIAAYKEEAWILKRLQNAIEQDYPRDGLEILVGCDGHEDLTGDLAEAFHDDRVRVVVFPERRGKASVLNDLVPLATGEVLVFTDANTLFERSAIKNLARHFDDATVGGVVGRLVLVDPESGSNADGMYWKFENFLKGCEGKLGAVLGANGGIYAIRRELYRPIPANTILDDFLIGMRIHETDDGCCTTNGRWRSRKLRRRWGRSSNVVRGSGPVAISRWVNCRGSCGRRAVGWRSRSGRTKCCVGRAPSRWHWHWCATRYSRGVRRCTRD